MQRRRALSQHAETLPKAIIVGCTGTALTNDERHFFRDFDPLGFILFARNCETPDQLRALTASLRDCVGRDDAPILIDMEGGPRRHPATPALAEISTDARFW